MSALTESKNKDTLNHLGFLNWVAFIRPKLNGEGLGKHVFDQGWINTNILRIDENKLYSCFKKLLKIKEILTLFDPAHGLPMPTKQSKTGT